MYQSEHPGYHLSLAKMDSAPSSSVVGIHGNGSGAHQSSSGRLEIFLETLNLVISVMSQD